MISATFLSVHRAHRNRSRALKSFSPGKPLVFCLQVMHDLHESSGPFLFPCTIEFSLICAAILFIMWKHVGPEHEYNKLARLRKLHDHRLVERETMSNLRM